MTYHLGSSANLELNRESRNHENELASLTVLYKADLLGDKWGLSSIPSYCFAPCLCLSCRVVAVTPQVWEIWSLKCLPAPSNLTTEVKETFFIILVTQQSKYFPEFPGYLARFEKYFITVRSVFCLFVFKCCFKSFPPFFSFCFVLVERKDSKAGDIPTSLF